VRLPMSQGQSLGVRFFYWSGARALLTNAWYALVTRLDKNAEVTLLNYGYAYPDGAMRIPDTGNASEKYSLQLYHHVATGVSLAGKCVLEVGCGRGGGASYIARHLHPREMVGVDIVAPAIGFAQRHYAAQNNLRFEVADAHRLPFEDDSFDAVVNIESAQHYRDVGRFLSEVRRVLKPGGHLLIAYFEDPGKGVFPRQALAQSGLHQMREEDITEGVVRAMDLDSSRRRRLAQKLSPSILRKLAVEFSGVRGTDLYNDFASGNFPYFYFVYRK
jgi:ubiquinone/menaquinone biosynthesis C-methylase UbiE